MFERINIIKEIMSGRQVGNDTTENESTFPLILGQKLRKKLKCRTFLLMHGKDSLFFVLKCAKTTHILLS